MCRYDVLGVCKDTRCSAQHFRELEMTTEEVVLDLVSYAPSLVMEDEGMRSTDVDASLRTYARGIVATFDLMPEQLALLATLRANESLGGSGVVHKAAFSRLSCGNGSTLASAGQKETGAFAPVKCEPVRSEESADEGAKSFLVSFS